MRRYPVSYFVNNVEDVALAAATDDGTIVVALDLASVLVRLGVVHDDPVVYLWGAAASARVEGVFQRRKTPWRPPWN